MKDKRYMSVKEAGAKYQPSFKESYIRHLVLNADSMGFRECFHKVNSKVIIDTKKFEAFVDKR